jgi:hypothetical protein
MSEVIPELLAISIILLPIALAYIVGFLVGRSTRGDHDV